MVSLKKNFDPLFYRTGSAKCGCDIAIGKTQKNFVTSKVDHLALVDISTENLDFHGEALCSISDAALLEIVTKARAKPNGYRKILKISKCLFLGINNDRLDVGTTELQIKSGHDPS